MIIKLNGLGKLDIGLDVENSNLREIFKNYIDELFPLITFNDNFDIEFDGYTIVLKQKSGIEVEFHISNLEVINKTVELWKKENPNEKIEKLIE